MKHVKNYLLSQIFNDFTAQDIEFLEKRTNVLKLKRGQPLFLAGDTSEYLYAVLSGSLKILRENNAGHSVITRIVGPKKLVGLREFFANFIYIRSCLSLEDSEILAIHHDAIMTLMKRNTTVSMHFIKLFATELKRMEDMLESHLNRSAKKRLSGILYDFYQMFSKKHSKSFRSPLKRKDLAELAGMSPETVSRILNELKVLKILQTSGRNFVILDPQALKRYDE